MHNIDKEDLERRAMSWALKSESVKVYPVLSNETYEVRMSKGGGKPKKHTFRKVNLVVQIGNGHHKGKFAYTQDEQMTEKINEIYLHYYLKSEEYKKWLKRR